MIRPTAPVRQSESRPLEAPSARRLALAPIALAGLLGWFCVLGSASAAFAERIDAASAVSAATLYPQGAAVTRVARFSAPAGRHQIVLDDLPVRIDADTLRVAGAADAAGDGFTIEGISHRIHVGAPAPLPEGERADLLGEIRDLEWARKKAEQEFDRAVARRAYMRNLRAATTAVDQKRPDAARPALIDAVDQWTTAWALIDAEISAADAAEREAGRRIEDLDEAIDALARRLDERPPEPPRGVATVSIDAAEPIENGVVEITYLTREASWSPLYDLRLDTSIAEGDGEDAATPAAFSGRLAYVRRAAIQQATGEDWNDVALTLSTARPTGRLDAGEPPIVQALLVEPVILNEADDRFSRAAPSAALESLAMTAPTAGAAMDEAAPQAEPERRRVRKEAREIGALAEYAGETVVFRLPLSADAPGDGSVRQVQIDAAEQEVALSVRATPSVDPTAYLYASFENGAAPLLPGIAAIYRDGVYLGRIALDFVAPGDEAPLAFGPYDNVVVSRVVTRTLEGDEGVFRVSTKRRHRFRLTAKNLGDRSVPVSLFDAAPYTETNQIEVNVIATPSPTERDVDGRRGAMAWTFDLPSGAEETIGFGYDLAWPEGETMILR